LTVVLAVLGFSFLAGDAEARRIRRRLRELAPKPGEMPGESPDILRDLKYSGIPALNSLLHRIPLARSLRLLLLQGDARMRVGTFMLLILVMAAIGAFAAASLGRSLIWAPPGALFLGSLPVMWAVQKKKKRMRDFERLFPDALDILTGALRAGLALTGAIQVVTEVCSGPITKEFTILFEETRLGVDMREALRDLADRVDCKELHLFVIAVLLHRETGGNLAEVLEGTANVIRERLRIMGDVRALTAQSRLSAGILSALPIALGLFIMVSAPDYMTVFLREQIGRFLLIGAAILQLVGFLIMRRIAAIKV
jgi:tight adherence protein B